MSLSQKDERRFRFGWEILDAIIGGYSSIDSTKPLSLASIEDAEGFIRCYGYEVENPIEKAELFGNFQEALSFVRRYFLKPENPEGLDSEIPRRISELTDVHQLLLTAAGVQSGGHLNSLWACAILKVMHTISHIDKDLRSNYYIDIQKQILDRFYKLVHRDESGMILGKDEKDSEKIRLVAFETKPKKSRDSVILKLLHKPENVAEDIFDRVGVRFITENRYDALRVVRQLKRNGVLMPANIKPSRSRNSLIDIPAFRETLSRLLESVAAREIDSDEVEKRLIDYCQGSGNPERSKDNPHSSDEYRAIQFTGRQLIKIRNPLYEDLKAVRELSKQFTDKKIEGSDTLSKIVEHWDLGRNIQKEIRFFYPFEVQILDQKSHQDSLAGNSSHANYKKSQIHAALLRVMGSLANVQNKS